MKMVRFAAMSVGLLFGAATPAVIAIGAGLALPVIAAAQPQRVEPYFVVVGQSDVPMRCGDSGIHYAVATLKSGAVLRVDGESAQWVRAAYPAGTKAFVKSDEATADAAGKTVRLIKPSKLRAANAAVGERGSYFPLLETELPSGTELTIVEAVKGDDGKVSAWAVAAPAAARGFVSRDAIRRATAEEVNAARAAGTLPGEAAPATTPPASTPPATPPPATNPPKGPTPAPVNPAPTTPPAATPPPTTPPASAPPASTPPTAPGDSTTVIVPGATPAPSATPPVMPPAPVEPPKPSPTESLLAMYDRVRGQSMMEAELDSAIAEFEKFMNGLGSSEADQRTRKSLDRYVAAMKLRREVRETYKANESANKALEGRETEVGKQVAEMERQRVYNVIGRLVASTVYDGQRLPLMYRLQSPEPVLARTLGYLIPDAKMDLSGKVGQIVGVLGESRFDEALKANVYSARKVDVISLAPVTAAPPSNPSSGGGKPPAERPASATPGTPAEKMYPVDRPATPEPAPTPAPTEPEKP